jgi:hypothetical protein
MDHVWPILGPLLGVVVGGFVTFLVSHNIEHQRWQQQKRDKRAEDKREAIAGALAWLDPMDRALIRAEGKVFALLHGNENEEHFRATFSYLLSELKKLDIPAEHRLLLPGDPYLDGNRIINSFENLKHEAID